MVDIISKSLGRKLSSAIVSLAVLPQLTSSLAVRHEEHKENCGITFRNTYGCDIYISGDWAHEDIVSNTEQTLPCLDHVVKNGSDLFIPMPLDTSPKFYLGLSPNQETAGSKRIHDTVVELTHTSDSWTYFDVDTERGLSVPVWCRGMHDEWDMGRGCEGDVLANCPSHLEHYHEETNDLVQCRSDSSRENIRRRRRFCPSAYVLWNDDRKGTATIQNGHSLECTILDPKNTTRTEVRYLNGA